MKQSGEFRVAGRREYRGHAPGTLFEASLDRNAIRRAVHRGDLEFIREVIPQLQPGSWTFPHGWLPPPDFPPCPQSTEAPRGASLVGKEA